MSSIVGSPGVPASVAVRDVLAGQATIKAWQEDLYRTLHQQPELSYQEIETAASAAQRLRQFGYEVHERIGTTGVVGILNNGQGPVVLVRADMDALPVRENTGLPYASTRDATDHSGQVVPVTHACGHDMHMACLLGAARLLAEQRLAWRGTFITLFQPAEEVATGAAAMINSGLAGLIATPTVALAQHVVGQLAGTVGTHTGPIFSTADSMRVTVHGRGGHGSMPQLAIDPVVLAAMIVVRLQTVVAREVPPGEFAVLTVGQITSGSRSNVIPDRAILEPNVRAYSDTTRNLVLQAIERIVRAECLASGCPLPPAFELYGHFPLTANHPDATATVSRAFQAYFGDRALSVERLSASEDFSEIPKAFGSPYTYWTLGGFDAEACESGRLPTNHAPEFAPVIQPTLETGTAAIVVAALAWLGEQSKS